MYKRLPTALALAILAFTLYGCAPGAITPQTSGSQMVSIGAYPPTTRAGHPNEPGFYITMGPDGLGLEVARGHWRGSLYAGYYGFNMRNSWSQDDFGVSLDTAYNAYGTEHWVDENGDGNGRYVYVYSELLGAALDGTYYFKVPTDIGSAYFGPRLRAYFACVSEDQAGYVCNSYGVLPGGALGITVPITAISERLYFGAEGSVMVVIPGLSDAGRFSIFSPFAFTISYRF